MNSVQSKSLKYQRLHHQVAKIYGSEKLSFEKCIYFNYKREARKRAPPDMQMEKGEKRLTFEINFN